MQSAVDLWTTVQTIKNWYDRYTPIINSLVKEKERVGAKMTTDPELKAKYEAKLTDIDTRINNLEWAKSQMLSLLEQARQSNEWWLIANKQSNAIAWARDRWVAIAWVSRAWWSVWEKLAVWMWIDAEINRRDLAAEEAAQKVKWQIYQTASTVPYNIETLAQNKAAQDRQARVQEDQIAMNESQLSDKQRKIYDERRKNLYNRYF